MEKPQAFCSQLLTDAGFSHAFFGRQGGVSPGPYRSLSFSSSVGDAEANVQENLRRAATVLETEPPRICFASQVHGSRVLRLEANACLEASFREEADALVTLARGVACGVRTADCVPVLIGERRTGAVAAAHAGWRGVVRGILPATIAQLRELSGADEFVAAIGPHISLAAFEVSEEVAQELEAVSSDVGVVDRKRTKPHVDLRRIVRAQLLDLGLRRQCIDDVQGCTMLEPEHFFSYRRDGRASGRHLSAIVARG